jgi:hypothetical protein
MITIVKAATRRGYAVYLGYRHADIMELMRLDGVISIGDPLKMDEQGFLTSEGNFVSRTEAADIAFKAGQIKSGIYSLDSYQVF